MTGPKPRIRIRNGRWTYSGMPRNVRSPKLTMRWARAQVFVFGRNKREKRQ